MKAGPFRERDAWLALPDERGGARVETLTSIAAPAQESVA